MNELLLLVLLLEIQYPVDKTLHVEWDHDLINVTKFEVQVDSTSWVSVGLNKRYLLPPLIVGSHIARVRSCNSVGCSSSLDVQFTILALVPTIPYPPNPVIIPTALNKEITWNQAREMTKAYYYLWRVRRLSSDGAELIVNSYAGPWIYESYIRYLEFRFLGYSR